jgi:hypothetical protein
MKKETEKRNDNIQFVQFDSQKIKNGIQYFNNYPLYHHKNKSSNKKPTILPKRQQSISVNLKIIYEDIIILAY